MNLDDLKVPKDHLKQVVKNQKYNKLPLSHYRQLHKKTSDNRFLNNVHAMSQCNSIWLIDCYEVSKIKDFKTTNLCRDKFCNNCKKVKQAVRMSKFIPLIRPYSENMYQLTLTVPNVKGEKLEATIDKMFKSFATLIEYLKGKKKIKDLHFDHWGYEGSIRSLEVTYDSLKKGRGRTDEYHPHIHALLVLKGEIGERLYKNVYSHDFLGKRAVRCFSEEEILIQKIWKLLNTGERVTLKNIESLDIGYSCQLDKFKENDFVELFKYMTKGTSQGEEMMRFSQFETLYYGLLNKRQIQGYGCFFGLKDAEITLDEVESACDEIFEELRAKENPSEITESPKDLLKDDTYTLISRKKVYSILKKLK